MNNTGDDLLKKGSYLLSSVFGLGFIKYAPGTICSLVALPLTGIIMLIGGVKALFVCVFLFSAIGYFSGTIALKYTEDEDPSFIVIDELAAQMATFLVPLVFFPWLEWSLALYVAGFLLFRAFDIFKPLDVGVVQDHVSGSFGVMLDDMIAAFYSTSILTALMWVYTMFIRQPAV